MYFNFVDRTNDYGQPIDQDQTFLTQYQIRYALKLTLYHKHGVARILRMRPVVYTITWHSLHALMNWSKYRNRDDYIPGLIDADSGWVTGHISQIWQFPVLSVNITITHRKPLSIRIMDYTTEVWSLIMFKNCCHDSNKKIDLLYNNRSDLVQYW